MPNHETNHVCVIARRPDVVRFLKDACEIDVDTGVVVPDFDRLVPQPQHVKQSLGVPGPAPAWYDWRNQHWGTKWEAYAPTKCEVNPYLVDWRDYPKGTPRQDRVPIQMVSMVFQTAWTQPTPILKAIADQFDAYVECLTFDEGGFEPVHFQSEERERVICKQVTADDYAAWNAAYLAKDRYLPKGEGNTDG